jgi:RNA polymerase sigma factor (sigma-70 family)
MKERLKRGSMAALVVGAALSAIGPSSAALPAQEMAIAGISRYCATCWRHARLPHDAWDDCTQDVFCRLLERVSPEAWDRILAQEGDERRELIRAVDAVKKRNQRARKLTPLMGDVTAKEAGGSLDRAAIGNASSALSDRQKKIIALSFDGWSVHDIASRLRVPAARVSDEKYKAVQRLRERLAAG